MEPELKGVIKGGAWLLLELVCLLFVLWAATWALAMHDWVLGYGMWVLCGRWYHMTSDRWGFEP